MTEFVQAWAGIDNEAHVAVTASGPGAEAVSMHVGTLVEDKVASRIAAKDHTLWGTAAEAESKIRLGWVELHNTTRSILQQLSVLVGELKAEGKTRIVLCGMGGSSLGPEVICRTYDVPLVTLDSTDPDQVRGALAGDLAKTVVVVSSKSGGTVETDSQRRAFEAAFSEAGLDPREHMVVVTDPGSPLEAASRDAGYREVFLADPNVGGRFSVLSPFGLVPSALAGVPVEEILDEAAAVAEALGEDDPANPALVLGASMAASGRDKLVLQDEGSGIPGLGDWIEQLVAESTGKDGVGILPVIAPLGAAELGGADVVDARLASLDNPPEDAHLTIAGTLGGQFLLWEYATAIVGRLLKISPFDQPNVESAKAAARGLLEATPEPEPATFIDAGIEVRATDGLLDGVETVEDAIRALEAKVDANGYVAVMAYLDRESNGDFAAVRDGIAQRTGRPVTFGWGPRFLHSTGQLHKGGAPVGVFLQITGSFAADLDIPGRDFSFATLISAQAAGDADVLDKHSRPVLRLNLTAPEQLHLVRSFLEA